MTLQQKSRSLMNLSRATGFAASPRHTKNKKLLRKNFSTTSLMSIYDDDIAESLSSTDESSVCSVSVSSTIPEQEEDEEEVHESLGKFSWFVGKLSRSTAEHCLNGTKNGTFLVRESEGQREYKHAIAVRWKNQPSHIRIYRRENTYSVCTYHSDYFNSIEELVAYYQKNTLGDNFPFVNTTLRFPYKSLFRGAYGKTINEYAEDFPGSPEPEPPELPPRTPSMSIINPGKTLQDQPWYHGKITRLQAEFLLSSKREFSFLLRDCESESNGFSLSIRESTSGYVHLRISREGEGYVLGKFSELFNSVPECVLYYCHHKLNVKGASHGCLRHPVYR